MLKGLLTRQIFVVIDVSLAAVLVLVAWMVVQRLMAQPSAIGTGPGQEIDTVTADLAKVAGRDQYQVIVANRLFGAAGQTRINDPVVEPPPPPPKVDAVPTSFQLRLVGTSFASTHPNAIVEHQGKTGVFRPGQEIIPNTLRLDEVHNRWVYLFNISKNQREILTMDKQAEGGAVHMAAAPPPPPTMQQRPVTARPMRPNEVPVSRDEIEMELESITTNLAEVHNTLNPRPYQDASGRVVGLTADNISSIPLASKLGFREGDVLTHINGMQIDSQEKITEALGRFQNSNTFRVTVLRNGKPELLQLRLTE